MLAQGMIESSYRFHARFHLMFHNGVQASNFPVHEMHEAFPPKAGAENI